MVDVDNLMLAGLGRDMARAERRDALLELAHGVLVAEYLAAAQTDPLAVIETPDWGDAYGGKRRMPMIQVLDEQLAGVRSDPLWAEMVTALTHSPQGVAFLRKMAEVHADYHEAAAAEL